MPTREYIPRRFVSSVPRHQAPFDALTGESLNWLIRQAGPGRTKMVRRLGQPTVTNWNTVLNTAWTGNVPRGRQIIGMRANQLTDKSQHVTALFTDDEGDKRGEVVTYDSDQADWYSLGQEYGTTHYPVALRAYGGTGAAGSGAAINFRWSAMWSNGTSTGRYLRGITATDRQLILAGGRANMEAGEWLFGTSDATPWMWRKSWNYATGSGSNENTLRPWGHQVPLFHPYVTATGGTATVKSWRGGGIVYYSCAFVYEDGSIGPFTPISDGVADAMVLVSSAFNGTRGRYVIPTASAYYTHMALTNIPRGPKGVVGRAIARSQQIDSTAYQASFPGPNDLRIVTIIKNNTETEYNDYQGDDETLIATPDLVRIDHKWPPRGKYLVANDKRFLMCGSMKPNPGAIVLAPTGITTGRDINKYGATGSVSAYLDDLDDQRADEYLSSPGTRGFYVELTGSSLRLRYDTGSAIATTTIDILPSTNYLTLQELVDLINQTLVNGGGGNGEWAAQLVPGVDGETLVNKLAPTTSSTATGDGTRAGGGGTTADYIWTRGPGDPVTLFFTKAYMDSFPTQEQQVEWTRGGPSDSPSAIMNWSASNETERSPGDAFVGRCLGAAPIGNVFAVFYERGIYRLVSNREGGADEDQRLVPVTIGNVHVVSDSSIFWGDGFAGCMTSQGVLVLDESGDYRMISGDVYDSEEGTAAGEWLNEITRSLKATQAGGRTTADDESYCYAVVLSDQIHVSYRKSATAANDRRMVYDFSPNAEAAGLAAVLDQGRPFGWSTPLTNTVGVMAEIADQSGGMVRYGIVENVAQGRIDKFDSGTVDGTATAVTATGYFATDFMDTLRLKQASQLVVQYAAPGTGLALVLARDQGTSPTVHGVDTYTHALATSGDDLYARKVIDLAPEARTPADVFELRITDDGNGSPPEVWRVALSYEVLDFPR